MRLARVVLAGVLGRVVLLPTPCASGGRGVACGARASRDGGASGAPRSCVERVHDSHLVAAFGVAPFACPRVP